MPGYAIINFFIYALINSFTPGPGNILALNTVANYGLQKGKPLFLGIFFGYYSVQIICAVFVYNLSSYIPETLTVIKYIGAIYIIWLSFCIVSSKPVDSINKNSSSFITGFVLQFVNVKIYIFGITSLTLYVIDYTHSFTSLVFYVLLNATIGTIATITWIVMGMIINKFYRQNYRIVNISLSIILLECVFSILK